MEVYKTGYCKTREIVAVCTCIYLKWQKRPRYFTNSSWVRCFCRFAIPESVTYCSICFLGFGWFITLFLSYSAVLSWYKIFQEEWYRVVALLISILIKVLLNSWMRAWVFIYIVKLCWNCTAKLVTSSLNLEKHTLAMVRWINIHVIVVTVSDTKSSVMIPQY